MSSDKGASNLLVVDAKSPFNDPKADVILRSSDNVDFRCYKLLLSMASPSFFEGMFSLPQPQEADGEMKDELPVIRMTETQDILRMLLKMCHPWARIEPPPDLEELTAVYRAATKYGMEPLEQQIHETLVSDRFLKDDPRRVFGIACHFRLEKEAKISARATLSFEIPSLPYVKELEYMTGGDHYLLLEYHTECGKAARGVAQNLEWLTETGPYIWFNCSNSVHDSHVAYGCVPGINHSTHRWWWDWYMIPAADVLQRRPSAATVTDHGLMDRAHKATWACENCVKQGYEDLRVFSQLFAEQIERVTSEVKFNLAWAKPESMIGDEEPKPSGE